jgi:aromatic ring-opening dioxygenase catalytic subunit (LigB family)
MDIVGAFACSHSGLIVTRRDRAPLAAQKTIFEAFAAMGNAIRALAPDAIVLVGTDHGRIYTFSGVPQFTIGVSDFAHGIGDAGLPSRNLAIHQRFAQAILAGCIDAGIDLAFSEAMAIDHSFIMPLMLALPDMDIPIIPIAQNCFIPPLPRLERSYEVGKKLGQAICNGPAGRVVVIGTGGLSHWVGSEAFRHYMSEPAGTRLARREANPLVLDDVGYVNDTFDREFLALICGGGARTFVDEWNAERLYREAGNGAQEVRNWLLAAAATGDKPGQVVAYAPVREWLTGTAVVKFDV